MMKTLVACAAFLAVAACADKAADSAGDTKTGAGTTATIQNRKLEEALKQGTFKDDPVTLTAVKKLRITAIPDSASGSLKEEFTLFGDLLKQRLGIDVEYKEAANYDAAVIALVSGEVDMAWLGGKTAYDAETQLKEKCVFVACRDIDLEFKSYFIVNHEVAKKHNLKTVKSDQSEGLGDLQQLKPIGKELTFTFGSTGSTSGHYMPRWYLNQAGMKPEATFRTRAYSGSHTKTLEQVASGQAQVGALNYTDWDQAKDPSLKDKAPILAIAFPYTDYCWVGSTAQVSKEDLNKIAEVIASFDGSNESELKMLERFGPAKRFFKANPRWWDDIRAVVSEVDSNKAELLQE